MVRHAGYRRIRVRVRRRWAACELTRLVGGVGVQAIVVGHRDRVARFGVEHLTAVLVATGRRVVVVDTSEPSTVSCGT